MTQPDTNQSAELKIRIHPELKKAARIQAKRCGMSLSEYIRDLIESDVEIDETVNLHEPKLFEAWITKEVKP